MRITKRIRYFHPGRYGGPFAFVNRLDAPSFAQNLKEALERKAGAEELSGILAGAGIDSATAEAILVECQLAHGASIGI